MHKWCRQYPPRFRHPCIQVGVGLHTYGLFANNVIHKLRYAGDITVGGSSRLPRTQRGGTSTGEVSRGSSYGHESPPQELQQPAPRHPSLPQPEGKCQFTGRLIVPRVTTLSIAASNDQQPKPRSMLDRKNDIHDPVIARQLTLLSRADAWHIVNNTDPLEDSDTEADEHVRLDYSTYTCRSFSASMS
jgi:hypothetical protein